MQELGNKVVVVGVSASGKTTFSQELSKKTGLPAFYMDSFMWNPGWVYVGDEVTAVKLDELSQQPQWIIEGYITTQGRATLFERADTIIYLDYSRWLSTWRYVVRWWKHRKNARPELDGSPEKFSFKMLWIVFTKGESITLETYLSKIPDQSKIITLKSPREAMEFTSGL